VTPIQKKQSSLRTYASTKLDQFEKFAARSTTINKILKVLYRSVVYRFISKKLNEFREYKLLEEIKQHPVPHHIAIIMDGNRRFAKSLNLSPETGHLFGREKIEEVLEWCFDLDIKILTIYAFSMDNFNRNSKEVRTLMNLFREELEHVKTDPRVHSNQVRIRVIGHLESLPKDIQKSAYDVMDITKQYSKYSLNLAIAYGGREEIIQAIQHIARDVKHNRIRLKDISERKVASYLYTTGLPDPDLILRTSGEERISNFLLWQLAYSELYFSDVYWPAFQKRDFLQAIRTYQNRQRRFGT